MRAIHWIRSRQESEELSYWLSFVSYNPKDRSLNNQIYLVYLLVFFSIWWFIVLVWFANTGASLLSLFFPSAALGGAIGLELIVLLIWFLTVLFLSLRRSPVAFSEEDAVLVCQMPFGPRSLVFRWSLMPWVKSVIPFLILAMVLGFSLAEIDLSQQGVTDPNIFAYIIRGVRAALSLLPVQMTAFMLIWANGVWIMSRQRKFLAWFVPILTFGLGGLLFGTGISAAFGVALPVWLAPFSQFLPGLLGAGLTQGMLGTALSVSGLSALVSILALVFSAGKFSPSQAAQETQTQVTNRNLRRYGFSDRVQNRKAQKRLGRSEAVLLAARLAGAVCSDLERYAPKLAFDQDLLYLSIADLLWDRAGPGVHSEPRRAYSAGSHLGHAGDQIPDRPLAGRPDPLGASATIAAETPGLDPGGPGFSSGLAIANQLVRLVGRRSAGESVPLDCIPEHARDDRQCGRCICVYDLPAFEG